MRFASWPGVGGKRCLGDLGDLGVLAFFGDLGDFGVLGDLGDLGDLIEIDPGCKVLDLALLRFRFGGGALRWRRVVEKEEACELDEDCAGSGIGDAETSSLRSTSVCFNPD